MYKVTALTDYQLVRAWLDFDLTDLPSGWSDTYSVVKLKLYIEKWDNNTYGSTGDIVVVQGVQNLPVQVSDYGAQVSYITPGGTLDADDFSSAGWYYITLNDTGKGWISAGGTFKICLRSSGDVNDYAAIGSFMHRPYIWTRDADVDKAARLVFEATYPTNALTRVTGIRHIYRPGLFRMILSLGDVSNTIEIAEHTVRKELEIPEQRTPGPVVSGCEEGATSGQGANKYTCRGGIWTHTPEPSYQAPTTLEELQERRWTFEPSEPFPASARVTAPRPQPPEISTEPSLWQRLTPWKEEEGETFGSEVAERFEKLRRLFGGMFGGGR